jgi:teichuronic acid biosynthesis glycosyltransferase TuaC
LRVLIIHSANAVSDSSQYTFVKEQSDALNSLNVSTDFYGIKGHGFFGYIKNLRQVLLKIREFEPDIIHAHYGLSGLLANLQRKIPVVCTYHGSDINNSSIFLLSTLSIKLSKHNIFVSRKMLQKVKVPGNFSVIPCGVDMDIFYPIDKLEARNKLGLDIHERLVLFSSSFSNQVKNYPLARAAINLLEEVRLLELKNLTRQEVCLMLNACDVALMTSLTEGSPMFIKEAMACCCPIVSVDVADVKEIISDTEYCFITSYNHSEIAEKIAHIMKLNLRTNGKERLLKLGLSNEIIGEKLLNIYNQLVN